jgi:uncharacterized membrane protein YeaQ/YmgE (transglycosylase-associated protein family)
MSAARTHVISDDALIYGALIGAFAGYIAYRAAEGKTSAGPVRFMLVGAFGGAGGTMLGLMLVADQFLTRGKAMAATFIGAALGAAVLCYVLRVVQPPDKTNR